MSEVTKHLLRSALNSLWVSLFARRTWDVLRFSAHHEKRCLIRYVQKCGEILKERRSRRTFLERSAAVAFCGQLGMRQSIALVVLMLALIAPPAHALVLHFDDLGAEGPIPKGYGGLGWSGAVALTYGGSRADEYYAHTATGQSVIVITSNDVIESLRMDIGFFAHGAIRLLVFAFLDGALVYGDGFILADSNPTPFFIQMGSADEIVFEGYAGAQGAGFGFDDLHVVVRRTAIAEPTTVALLTAPLLFIYVSLRRRS